MSGNKVILVIMDGWGLGKVASADAIQNANVPFTKSLYSKYPNTTLITCGEAVGLPDGQMGNSEVGHLNIGAGFGSTTVSISNGDIIHTRHSLGGIVKDWIFLC